MKGEDFLKELNHLEESIIEEAREPAIRKKRRVNGNLIKFVGLAACIMIFTGAVVARNVKIPTKKDIHSAKENTQNDESQEMSAQKETRPDSVTYDEAKIEEKEETQEIVWLNYDVNEDGITDRITIDIPKDYESKTVACTITDGDSNAVLYQTTFSTSSDGWGELYLHDTDEKPYFIEYRPVLEKGIRQYEYEVFVLDKEGKISIDNNAIVFDLANNGDYSDTASRMAEFYSQINSNIKDSMLLISTRDGEIEYSTEENSISKQEEYKFLYEYGIEYTEESMYRKLEQYFTYIGEYLQYNKENISLILDENTLTSSGAFFRLENTGNIYGYSGEDFSLEIYTENGWEPYYTVSKEELQDISWTIAAKDSYNFQVDWSSTCGNLENGSYRLVKCVSFNSDISIDVSCVFDIYENIDNAAGTEEPDTNATVKDFDTEQPKTNIAVQY